MVNLGDFLTSFLTSLNNLVNFPGDFVARPPSTPLIGEEEDKYDDECEEYIDLENTGEAPRPTIDLSNCQCAEVLASVFPQLVDHWRAAGNKLKTLRYLTESGAAALATSANMQALSYLYEVQTMIKETKKDEQPLATREETARVESLIGQVGNGRISLPYVLKPFT